MEFTAKVNKILLNIAKENFSVDTLETKNTGEDYSEASVWGIKEALEEAYKAGYEAGEKGTK
ncbi:hypothetical protein EOL70_13365 [Leucothrix sargassi]|nr:hypothetical protein EOL70_13365 [Leucothrix sargassi]